MSEPVLGTNDVVVVLQDAGIKWSPVTVAAYAHNGKFLAPAGKLNGRTNWWWRSDVEQWIKDRKKA